MQLNVTSLRWLCQAYIACIPTFHKTNQCRNETFLFNLYAILIRYMFHLINHFCMHTLSPNLICGLPYFKDDNNNIATTIANIENSANEEEKRWNYIWSRGDANPSPNEPIIFEHLSSVQHITGSLIIPNDPENLNFFFVWPVTVVPLGSLFFSKWWNYEWLLLLASFRSSILQNVQQWWLKIHENISKLFECVRFSILDLVWNTIERAIFNIQMKYLRNVK